MSRLRTAEAAGNNYQGRVGGDQYFTVQAPSSDKAVQGYKQQVEQTSRTKTKELERDIAQERSEKEYKDALRLRWLQKEEQIAKDKLDAQQQVDKNNLDLHKQYVGAVDNLRVAEVQAQGQVAAANLKVAGSIIKGITSLSSSYLKYRTEMIEIEEKEAIKNETISMLTGVQGAIVGEQAQVNETALQNLETTEVNAINTSVKDPITADEIAAPIQEARTTNNQRSTATMNFGMGMDGALRDFMESGVQIRFPSGRTGTPSSARTNSEVEFALQVGLGQYMQGANLNGMSTSRLNVLANQAQNAIRSIGSDWSKTVRDRRIDNLTDSAYADFQTAYRAGQPPSMAAIDRMAASLQVADYKLSPLEARDKAVKQVIQTYANAMGGRGDKDALAGLLNLRMRDGRTIGDVYGDQINTAIRNSEADFTAYEKNLTDEIQDDMFAQLSQTEDRDERIQIAEQAVARLEAEGLYQEANSLKGDIQNLSLPGQGKVEYNTILGRIQEGEITDPASIDEAVSLNKITAAQGEQLKNTLKTKNETKTPNDKQAKDLANAEAKRIYNEIAGAMNYSNKDNNGNYINNPEAEAAFPPALLPKLKQSLEQDVNRIVNQVLVNDPSLLRPEKETEKLRTIQEALRQYYEQQVTAKNGKWYTGDAATTQGNESNREGAQGSSRVNSVFAQRIKDNLTNPNNYSMPTSRGTWNNNTILRQQDFTSRVDTQAGTVPQDVVDEFNAIRGDKVVNINTVKQWADAYNQGKIDPTLEALSTKLNKSPLTLLKSQVFGYGLGNNIQLNWPEPVNEPLNFRSSGGVPTGNGSAPLTSVQGAQLLMSMGVPAKGAAWLAGNISQESGWIPNRQPWDDVGAPAGGLVSWRAGRLQAIQQQIGRPISEITTREQLTYMLQEMRTSYPAAYRRFMNPLSSDRQLIEASEWYWGYAKDAVGERFNNARYIERDLSNFSQPSSSGGRTHAYTTGNIGPTSTGQHLDVKASNGMYFNLDELDNFVEVDDRDHGTVTLAQLRQLTNNVGDSWDQHAARGSHGWDVGTWSGTKVYLKNGARVVGSVPTEHGNLTTIRTPNGREYTFLHGSGT